MRRFFDSNVLIYAWTTDPKKARAIEVIAEGGVISVQALNEVANVFRWKLGRDWQQIEQALDDIRSAVGAVEPLTLEDHRVALTLARDHGVPLYDAMIIAVAQRSQCDVLLSEDLQNGRTFGSLTVTNPFL